MAKAGAGRPARNGTDGLRNVVLLVRAHSLPGLPAGDRVQLAAATVRPPRWLGGYWDRPEIWRWTGDGDLPAELHRRTPRRSMAISARRLLAPATRVAMRRRLSMGGVQQYTETRLRLPDYDSRRLERTWCTADARSASDAIAPAASRRLAGASTEGDLARYDEEIGPRHCPSGAHIVLGPDPLLQEASLHGLYMTAATRRTSAMVVRSGYLMLRGRW